MAKDETTKGEAKTRADVAADEFLGPLAAEMRANGASVVVGANLAGRVLSAAERMRAADREDDAETRKDGHAAGVAWAEKRARPSQLRRLEREDNRGLMSEGEPDAYGWAGMVYFAIFGERGDREELHEFCDVVDCDHERMYELEFARGFVEGALEFWRKVEPLL